VYVTSDGKADIRLLGRKRDHTQPANGSVGAPPGRRRYLAEKLPLPSAVELTR